MHTHHVRRTSLIMASLLTALAATGCVGSEGDDGDDLDDTGTNEQASTGTAATTITVVAKAFGSSAGSYAAKLAFNALGAALGVNTSVSLSRSSMEAIAALTGKAVRTEFYNLNDVQLHTLYDEAGAYSRPCTTTNACPKSYLGSLNDKVDVILRDARYVTNFYQEQAYRADRLLIVPQLLNSLMLRTTFSIEQYKVLHLQAPTVNNEAYRRTACSAANDAVNIMKDIDGQLYGYASSQIENVQFFPGFTKFGIHFPNKYCFRGQCWTDTYASREAYAARSAVVRDRYNQQRPTILGGNFDTILAQQKQFGAC